MGIDGYVIVALKEIELFYCDVCETTYDRGDGLVRDPLDYLFDVAHFLIFTFT